MRRDAVGDADIAAAAVAVVAAVSALRVAQWVVLAFGPHLHGDLPSGLDGVGPDLFENQLAFGALEVVVAFHDVSADAFNVCESLVDEAFHCLRKVRGLASVSMVLQVNTSCVGKRRKSDVCTYTYPPLRGQRPREAVLPPHGVLEFDGLLVVARRLLCVHLRSLLAFL